MTTQMTVSKRREYFANNMNNFISLVAKYEHCIYRLLPQSRQAGYSTPVRAMIPNYRENNSSSYNGRKNALKEVFNTRNVGSHRAMNRNRYCGLNFQPLFERGSCEFRYHQGSLNFNKLSGWIILTQAFIETAENKKSIVYTDSLKKVSVATAMRRMRRDLGLNGYGVENDVHLKHADSEVVRRFKHYKSMNIQFRSIINEAS